MNGCLNLSLIFYPGILRLLKALIRRIIARRLATEHTFGKVTQVIFTPSVNGFCAMMRSFRHFRRGIVRITRIIIFIPAEVLHDSSTDKNINNDSTLGY